MTTAAYLRCYAITALVFLALDAVWLGLIGPVYRDAIGGIMRAQPWWPVAAGFYLFFVIGLLVFAIYPATTAWRAALLGGLFGAFTYATYELTNLALIAGWPVWLAGADILWGSLLCALSAAAGYRFR